MMFYNQQNCKRCGSGMQVVATIAPIGGKPGLEAFVCANCGASRSVLLYPDKPDWKVDQNFANQMAGFTLGRYRQ
jgi:hypothetical protein